VCSSPLVVCDRGCAPSVHGCGRRWRFLVRWPCASVDLRFPGVKRWARAFRSLPADFGPVRLAGQPRFMEGSLCS